MSLASHAFYVRSYKRSLMIGAASVEDQRSVPDSMYAHQQYNGISFPLVFFSIFLFFFFFWAFSFYRVEFYYHLTARGTAVLDALSYTTTAIGPILRLNHKSTTHLPTQKQDNFRPLDVITYNRCIYTKELQINYGLDLDNDGDGSEGQHSRRNHGMIGI